MLDGMATAELLFIEQHEERLDRWIVGRFPEVTRTTVQRWIEQGLVLVNGEVVKKRYKPEPGDEVQIQFAPPPELCLTPEPMDLDILYEDDALLVLHKPAGLVVHPGAGNASGTLVNGLLHHCQQLPAAGVRPGLVHRLDKDTSGVLVVAKTPESHLALVRQFAEREVQKTYLAVCHGTPPTSSCNEPIGRDPRHRQRMAAVPTGKAAETSWRILGTDRGLSLLEVHPKTGRTHQIRVHLQWAGCPILGDSSYTFSGLQAIAEQQPRHWLHASRLSFTHPSTGERLTFQAPPPAALLEMLPPALATLLT